MAAMIGLAAALALALVGLPWLLAPRSDAPPPGGVETSSPSPTAAATPTDAPLAHAQKWYLAFDYPAAWKLADQNALSMADPNPLVHLTFIGSDWASSTVRSIGFVGSGSATEKCADQDPSNPGHMLTCTTTWVLPAGSVEVRFQVASDARWNGMSVIDGLTLPGYTQTTIAGLPALFQKTTSSITNAGLFDATAEVVPDADEVLSWLLPTQHAIRGVFQIDAAIRGPDVAKLDAQVRAMMASLRWDPATYSLPTDPSALQVAGQAATQKALTWLKTSDTGKAWQYSGKHLFDCFPTTPGDSRGATITYAQQHPLKKPLRVTCATDIAPNAIDGWTLSLTHSWAAGPGYAAGHSTGLFDLAPDGTVLETNWNYEGWTHDVYPNQG